MPSIFFLVIFINFQVTSVYASSANPIDQAITNTLAWDNPKTAAKISDYTLNTLIIAPYGYALAQKEHRWEKVGTIAVMQLMNKALYGYAKTKIGRTRPNGEDTLSFFSGHSSVSALGAAMICGMHNDSCVPAVLLAGTTAYLRIAAKKHWFSDVVVGLGVGYLNGRYIPNIVVDF